MYVLENHLTSYPKAQRLLINGRIYYTKAFYVVI